MKYFLLFLLSIPQLFFAQQDLKGKVVVDDMPVEGVLIVNYKTKQNTVTNELGEFVIKASPNDIITIASPKIEGVDVRLFEHSFHQVPLLIRVKWKAKQLDEVKVENITTKTVGIPQPVRTYTPAERKLKTAGDLKWYSPLLIPVGGMSVDGLLNKISGRTAMLKKELQLEKYETNYKKLKQIFPNDFYIDTLKIDSEYVEGFLIYASENPKIISIMLTKNQPQLKFALMELSVKFMEQKKTK